MDKKDFKYELSHDQFKELLYEIQAIHSFNYHQFKKLTQITNHIIEAGENPDKDVLINIVREITSFNFKQHKKLKRVIWGLNKTLDPKWSPPGRVKNPRENSLGDHLPPKD